MIAFGEPGDALRKSIDLTKITHNNDQALDVVGFIIGDEDSAKLSPAAMVEPMPGSHAIGTVVLAKDRQTFGFKSCDVLKIDIRKLSTN